MLSLVIAGSGATAVAVAPVITHSPRVVTGDPKGNFNTWAASNWSGYAESGSFTGVSGTWTVPSVTATSSASYSSVWIGVDGFNNNSLIQTGTEEDYYNGATHYNAWWEILPAAETAISLPVAPGDRMSASIYKTANTVTVTTSRGFRRTTTTEPAWVITITDTTAGKSFTTTQGYNGQGTSAEWIVEAPQVGGRIAPLAHYSFGTAIDPTTGSNVGTNPGDFDAAQVEMPTSNGFIGANLSYSNDAGVMLQNNQQVSTPSNPDSAGTAYDAYYGATAESQNPVPATPAPTG